MIAGRQLPLCARCTGMFVGAFLGLVLQARKRPRAALLPGPRVLGLMSIGGIAWIVDGINSYTHFITGTAPLYTPRHVLRLVTGMSMGLLVSAVVYPMLNLTLWRITRAYRALERWQDAAVLLLSGAALAGVVLQPWPFLLYVLWSVTAISALSVLSTVNGMIVVILLRRENHADGWKQAVMPLTAGLLLSVVEVGAMALLRQWAAEAFPWIWSVALSGV